MFCWIYTFLFLKYYVGDWSRRQAYDQIVQATHLSTPHRKTDENSEIMKLNFNLSLFWAIYKPFKGYQTDLGIFRMARGVPGGIPLVKKNDQN